MKLVNIYPKDWPPILINRHRSFWIVVRDIVITLLGWLILAGLLQDFWALIYNWLKYPIFVLDPEDSPDWHSLWERFHPFAIVASFLIISILSISYWRRHVIGRTIESHFLTPEEETDLIYRQSGMLPSEVADWHRFRDTDVYLDDASNIVKVVER